MPARTVTISFLGSTAELEAALKRAGLVADESGSKIGDAFSKGADKAGGAISKLGQEAANWGVPFASSLQTVGKHLDETTSKTQKLHATMSEAGKVTLLAGGAGLAAVAVEAVKLGTAYQTAQASIQGATGQSVKSVSQLTKAFGATAGSSMESGQAMEAAYAGVAGVLKLTEGHALSTAEAMHFSAAANNLAEASGEGVASSYSAVAKVMQVFHMSASQAGQASDTLYSTSKALGVPVEEVASAMAKLHARLGAVAPSMGDVAGLMVSLGEHGLTGGRGVLVANTALSTLLGGSKKTDEVLKALGVSVYDSSGKFVGMQSVIAQLQPKLAGLTQQQQRFAEAQLFGKGATEVMGQVIRAGVPAFDQATAAAQRHGAALKAAELQQKTFRGEMQTLKATVETLGGDLGLILIPKITAVAKALAEGIQWLEKHKAAAIALASVIAGVLGTAVAVFAYDKAKKFGEGISSMVGDLSKFAGKITGTTAVVETQAAQQAAATEAAAGRMAAANEAAFADLGPAAVSGTAQVETAVAGETTAVTAADGTIEADNAIAGKSFTAMLGPIGLATAAVIALNELMPSGSKIENLLGGNQPGESGKEGEAGVKGGKSLVGGGPTNAAARSVVSLKNLGLGTRAAEGVVKALQGETQGNLEKGAGEEGREGAYGIAQWLGSRRAGLESFAKSKHEPKSNLEVQLEYLAKELKGPEHGTLAALQHARGPGEAAGIFIKRFERPEVPGAVEQRAAEYGSPSSKALQEQMEEASGAKPKKKAGAKAKAELYVDPFAGASGLQRSRTDQGVDFSFAGPLGAIGAGTIARIIQDPGGFGTEIVEKLTQGARKGQYVYSGLETGATLATHEGAQVRAGQMIARGKGTGGVELGFASGPGGVPITPYPPGASHEIPTAGGQAFSKFLGAIGKGGTVLSQVTKAAETAEKAEAKRLTTLEAAGKKLLGEGAQRGNLQSAIQSGEVGTLEKVLGVSTGGATGTKLSGLLSAGTGPLGQSSLVHAIMPTLAESARGTPTGKAFDKLIADLRATHQAGLVALANSLTQAHKQALADLGRELYAVTQERQAAAMTNEATEMKDRTAESSNLAAKQLQIAQDQSTQVTDAMSAAAKEVADATTIMKDAFAEMVEAVQLATQQMSDVAGGEVQQTQDKTAIAVAELGERGKYGLELVAQKLEVQLDQMKAAYDIQIQQAKMAVDQAKITGQQLTAEKQQGVDLLQAHEDVLVSAAQAHADAVQVAQDQAEASAQAQLDTAQLSADIGIDMAKQAAVLVAGGTKAQQAAAKGFEAHEMAAGQVAMATAEAHVKAVESAANVAIKAARGAVAKAQGESEQAMASAQQALAQAEGQAKRQIAEAEQGLVAIEGTAHVAEAGLEGQVAITRAEAQTQFSGSGLQVNLYGLNPSDAAGNASELGWVLRSLVPLG